MLCSAQGSAFTTRTSRPRINTNRTRPYHNASTRPNASRKLSTACKYFLLGTCTANDTCRYQHVLPASHGTEDLDRQLLAFISEDTAAHSNDMDVLPASANESSPFSPMTPSVPALEGSIFEHEELSDDEELYEIVPHPDTCVAEVRYHSILHPDQSRTYFVAQRQAVVGYEGNNVGVLSGGVLLGIPGRLPQVGSEAVDGNTSGIVYDFEVSGSSSPASSVSNHSDVELWKGPVNFDDTAVADRLVWADDEFAPDPMEDIEPSFCPSAFVLPTPPPVIRRIIRSAEHNRRHSLS